MRFLILFVLALGFSGCTRQSQGSQGGELTVIYLADLPDDAKGWAGLASGLKDIKGNPLVVVDDTSFSRAADLGSWNGEKETFLLESIGCNLFFPPASWQLLGGKRLAELSSGAGFFVAALNLADSFGNYPLSRYLIRQHSPYRVAFSAAMNPGYNIRGLRLLSLDSIIPVTATFLRMQSDYFFYFDAGDSLPEGVQLIRRYDPNSRIDIRFVSSSEVKMRVRKFEYQSQAEGESPLAMWQAHADSLDSEVLFVSDRGLSRDSLNVMALEILRRLIEAKTGEADAIFLALDTLVYSGVPAGEVTLGMMRKVMRPETFFLADANDLGGLISSSESAQDAGAINKRAVVPLSSVIENEAVRKISLEPTGITSVLVAKEIFNKESE